jgi:hypothetical protein
MINTDPTDPNTGIVEPYRNKHLQKKGLIPWSNAGGGSNIIIDVDRYIYILSETTPYADIN